MTEIKQRVDIDDSEKETFRAVVESLEKHQAIVKGVRSGLAKLPSDFQVRLGDVVEVYRKSEYRWIIQGNPLPYHEVHTVEHSTESELIGTPMLENERYDAFRAGQRLFYLNPENAVHDVRIWRFSNAAAEADYVARVIQGALHIPNISLSTTVLSRLRDIGADLTEIQEATELLRSWRTELNMTARNLKIQQENIISGASSLDDEVDIKEARLKEINDEYKRKSEEAEKLEASQVAARQNLKSTEESINSERKRLTNIKLAFQNTTNSFLNEERDDLKNGRESYSTTQQAEEEALKEALKNLESSRETTPEQLIALHIALKYAPFTVLAGPSGSGKTSLLLAYAQQMNIHVTKVAVQPGWTSVQDLHGYVNPLQRSEYRTTPFFEALGYQVRQAATPILHSLFQEVVETDGPLDLVLLDEINLSHVEYFLADYLSALELDKDNRTVSLTTPDEAARLALTAQGEPDDTQPLAWLRHLGGQVNVPRSFLIAGTANEDHTTSGFSDKFRDRAAFLHVEAPRLQASTLKHPQDTRVGTKYLTQQSWEAWIENGTSVAMSQKLIDFSEDLRKAKLPVSVRLFQRTARMSGDAQRLLEALGVSSAAKVALDLSVSLGIAHKYTQLTEGRGPEMQEKRKQLREALEKLLAGEHKATYAALGWDLEQLQ